MSPQALLTQMNRATAEVQKALSEEEGLAPVLAWVKALVDEVLASEFGLADAEFAWTPTATVDAVAQEQVLSSYTSRGILTLNEARAALGRAPLPDAAADRAMALVATGYVGLTGAAAKLGKADGWDEAKHRRWPAGSPDGQGGRFAPSDAGSSPSQQHVPGSGSQASGERLAEVIPICIKGPHSTTLIDGLWHYRAQYDCRDGTTIERHQIGKQLPGIILQP